MEKVDKSISADFKHGWLLRAAFRKNNNYYENGSGSAHFGILRLPRGRVLFGFNISKRPITKEETEPYSELKWRLESFDFLFIRWIGEKYY